MTKIVLFIWIAGTFFLGEGDFSKEPAFQPVTEKGKKIAPTYENVAYGDFDRNILDFWKAEADFPTPLVVYIHGGGFISGSKEIKFMI